ncbi:MAG: flagellar export protein FliJ [Cellvibrionaceae bacterium]
MAKPRSKRMLVVLDMAERAEKSAAQTLEQARHQVAHAKQQFEQVSEYQAEYERALNQPKQAVSVQVLMNDRLFLAQLVQVVTAQRGQLDQLRAGEDSALHNWQLCYQRRKNIEKLINSLKNEEDAVLEKKLQKEMDELSMLSRRQNQ